MDKTYCRFCATPKAADKQLNLLVDEAINDEIQRKLSFLNAMYLNISPSDSLPKTVCFVCYESLNKAYDFLDRARQSQDVLTTIFSTSDNTNALTDDDDKTDCMRDFCDLDEDSNDLKPLELLKQQENELLLERQVPQVEIKKELKEDISESNSNQCCDQINVQEILDAALNNGPLQIYGKEIPTTKEKDIKSWSDYPWTCAFCDMEFFDIETLRTHAKSVHMSCGAFKCYDCKMFSKKDNIKLNFLAFIQHVKKHRKELRKCCHYCNKELRKKVKLTKHLKEHIIRPQIPCEYCGEICSDELALHEHLQTFTENKQQLRKPRRKKGAPITVDDLTCEICKNVYSNPNSLRDHKKRHSEDWKKNYTCDRCGKTFYKKGTLTSHINAHDKIRPYICKICNRSFPFPNMLRRHVEMHSGVKPFSCEQCGRCFRLQYQLKTHKIVHTDSMPYVCQFCNKAFRFKQILNNHERQHTGAKPYSCEQCSMAFTNWSNYNKHMKRRHNTDTSKKKITPEGVFPVNPTTGELITFNAVDVEEWRSKVMLPCKRGKKKVIKQETTL